jgi:hypothetical protein
VLAKNQFQARKIWLEKMKMLWLPALTTATQCLESRVASQTEQVVSPLLAMGRTATHPNREVLHMCCVNHQNLKYQTQRKESKR